MAQEMKTLNKTIYTAIVLVGGQGARLKPLTNNFTKSPSSNK
jgi:ADP-glucose pyrophosphorylase